MRRQGATRTAGCESASDSDANSQPSGRRPTGPRSVTAAVRPSRRDRPVPLPQRRGFARAAATRSGPLPQSRGSPEPPRPIGPTSSTPRFARAAATDVPLTAAVDARRPIALVVSRPVPNSCRNRADSRASSRPPANRAYVRRVRATSLPTAIPVAAAALALAVAVLAPLVIPSTAVAERWLRPVPGEVARPFSYTREAPFARGAHRGADLTAAPGTTVRAACSGQIVHAGPVAGSDDVVSVRCRSRRVSYLPLAAVAVRPGAFVRAGDPIGTLAAGHDGLHVGVRRERDPFGYVDPTALLPGPERPFIPNPQRPRPRPMTPRPAPRPALPRPAAPRAAPEPAARPAVLPPASRPVRPRPAARPALPRPAARPASWPATSARPLAGRPPRRLAPWPVWAGLGALLAGAAGSRTVAVRRRRTTRVHAAVAVAPR